MLRSGSRIKISGSLESDKSYVIDKVHPQNSSVELTEISTGTSLSNSSEISLVRGPLPYIFTEVSQVGSNRYDYYCFFVGNYREDVPLMNINKIGDGICAGNETHMISGMNRNTCFPQDQ